MKLLQVISLHRLYHTKPSPTHTHADTENGHQRFKNTKLMIDFRGWMSRASHVNSSSAPYGQGCHFSFPPKGLDILVNIIENNNLMLPETQLHHRDHVSYLSVIYCLLYLIDILNIEYFPLVLNVYLYTQIKMFKYQTTHDMLIKNDYTIQTIIMWFTQTLLVNFTITKKWQVTQRMLKQ